MEAGGRDSLAAAYEAMAAKEAVVAGGLWGVDWMTFPFDCRKTELAYINMCIYIYIYAFFTGARTWDLGVEMLCLSKKAGNDAFKVS